MSTQQAQRPTTNQQRVQGRTNTNNQSQKSVAKQSSKKSQQPTLLIKIDSSDLSKNTVTTFNALFSGDKKEKFIIKKSNTFIIVKPTLFDYLEYDFVANRNMKRKLKYSLLAKNVETNKYETAIGPCVRKSEDYDTILRAIRMI